jgi:4-hydroxy-tetrahydrodipicolinate reductase
VTGQPGQRPRVVLTGATGKTGNAVAHGLAARTDVELVACVAPSLGGAAPTRAVPEGVSVAASLGDVAADYDVLVDLTHAGPAQANVLAALGAGAHVVLGTTGIDPAELRSLGARAEQAGLGLLYAPNFAIGAVLMMRFAADAARLIPDVEIVETHHGAKRDAPSGTARRTAELVAAARAGAGASPQVAALVAGDSPARGEGVDGVPVHSLRLPGAVAHQQVVLSDVGEVLTISHDAVDRSCYAAGVARAVRGVSSFTGLRTGLEHVL